MVYEIPCGILSFQIAFNKPIKSEAKQPRQDAGPKDRVPRRGGTASATCLTESWAAAATLWSPDQLPNVGNGCKWAVRNMESMGKNVSNLGVAFAILGIIYNACNHIHVTEWKSLAFTMDGLLSQNETTTCAGLGGAKHLTQIVASGFINTQTRTHRPVPCGKTCQVVNLPSQCKYLWSDECW